MSELLDVVRREMGKFEEFRRKIEGFRQEVERSGRMEGEISELLKKAKPADLEHLPSLFLEAITTGRDPMLSPHLHAELVHLVEHLRHLIGRSDLLGSLRVLERRSSELQRLIELAKGLGIPEEPPYSFSKPLDLEVEIPSEEGLRRARIRELRLEHGVVYITYEAGGRVDGMKIGTPLDLLFLLPVYPQLVELLEEAAGRYRAYVSELERLKKRLISEHSREILAHDL
jgi:hypothetical protein